MDVVLLVIFFVFTRITFVYAQCSYQSEGESGSFISPNYPRSYPPLADCNWTITVSVNHSVQLTFNTFDIEDDDICSFDKLIVRDGSDCTDPILAVLCGSDIPSPIVSSGHNIYLQFFSSNFVQKKGFNATFQQVPQLSETSVNLSTYRYRLETNEGTFATPNYPGNFPRNIECVWEIITSSEKRILLKFEDFNLFADCFMARVDVYDGLTCSHRLLRQCGLISPAPVKSTGNHLMVVFTSSGQNNLRGFRAKFVTFNKSMNYDDRDVASKYLAYPLAIMLAAIITLPLYSSQF